MAEHGKPPFRSFQDQLLEYLEAAIRANGLGVGDLATPEEIKARMPQLTVRKVEGYLPIPEEILMDEGLIPDTRPPRPRARLRTRLRWRVTTYRERLGLWAYWAITGDRIKTDDD